MPFFAEISAAVSETNARENFAKSSAFQILKPASSLPCFQGAVPRSQAFACRIAGKRQADLRLKARPRLNSAMSGHSSSLTE